MNKYLNTVCRVAATAITAAAVCVVLSPASAHADTTAVADWQQVAPASAGDGTPQGAVQWYQAHNGDTSYQGLCEKAAENAYGTTGVWASAIAHWRGAVNAGKAHQGDMNPPLGAFVYWNISQYGHVGIADGNGGFYASSVNGAIGHGDSLNYFSAYLGWSDPQVPRGAMPAGVTQH
jgi:hypothetical protein